MRMAFLAGLVVLAFLSSCTKDKTSDIVCPPCPDSISFKAAIVPFLQNTCAIAGCHDAITRASSLDLDSNHAYAAITERGTGNVTPGDPGNSLVYTLVSSGGMPLNLPHLSPCQVQDLGCWISQGAQNN